jgi:hypothetical protein
MKKKQGSKASDWPCGLLITYSVVSVIFSFLTKADGSHTSLFLALVNPVYYAVLQYSLSVPEIAGILAFPVILLVCTLIMAALSD